ncbi:hypothetical protein [Streptomyces pinistramenti]|uniref:hypothetical protein n=1 Tax=Streptomyces pinistramenti TaxID=2884812 RepID=UPI001D0955C4|nr:hypothetical protein [Streptomyces pinistramenti]MCB5907812.1 hypothetical protein [Streptomyces pinistramenti]
MSPDDRRRLADLTEQFRHPAPRRVARPAARGRQGSRPVRQGGRLLLAVALGGLAYGIAVSHGLVIAACLMLAGLAAQLVGRGRGRRPWPAAGRS